MGLYQTVRYDDDKGVEIRWTKYRSHEGGGDDSPAKYAGTASVRSG